MLFKQEKINEINISPKPFERGYRYYLAAHPDLNWLRKNLEKAYKNVPNEKRNKIFQDFWSSDEKCISTITELIIYGKLFEKFENVEIEPELDIVNGKTPDFLVNRKYCIEVLTVYHDINPIEYSIRETINSIESEFRIILTEIRLTSKKQPKLSEIKKKFKSLFDENNELESRKYFKIEIIPDLEIFGFLERSSKEIPNIQGLVENIEKSKNDYIESVRNSVLFPFYATALK